MRLKGFCRWALRTIVKTEFSKFGQRLDFRKVDPHLYIRKLQMQIQRQQVSTLQPATQVHPSAPTSPDNVGARATRLAERADAAIARILSQDSRAFLDANIQTGGQ